MRGRRGEAVEGRQLGRFLPFGTEVGEQHPRRLPQRIAALAHAMAQCRGDAVDRRFGRCFQAAAVGGEFPAVEGAAHAIAFVARVLEVGAAMRALAVEQAVAARGVAPQDQVLSEQAHRLQRALGHRRVEPGLEFVEQGDRVPVAAQKLAARRVRADAGDQFILGGSHGRAV